MKEITQDIRHGRDVAILVNTNLKLLGNGGIITVQYINTSDPFDIGLSFNNLKIFQISSEDLLKYAGKKIQQDVTL